MKSERTKAHVIAHRGASGYVPEHSIASYSLAADLGADYIELDLVLSKDGIFHAIHDLRLDSTTNVADFSEFKNRSKTTSINGKVLTGYFVDDFNSTELKRLRLKQRLPDTRSNLFDNLLEIPTLTDVLAAAGKMKTPAGRKPGLYVELKHPNYFRSLGFSMEDMVLEALVDANYVIKDITVDLFHAVGPVVLQCFTSTSLVYLKSKCNLPLVQLLELSDGQEIRDVWNAPNLDAMMVYANGVGPPTSFFSNSEMNYTVASNMMLQATSRGMVVHPYVIKSDSEIQRNSTEETLYFLCCLEVSGIFTDYTDRTSQLAELTLRDPFVCRSICPSKLFPRSTVGIDPDLPGIFVHLLICLVCYYLCFRNPSPVKDSID